MNSILLNFTTQNKMSFFRRIISKAIECKQFKLAPQRFHSSPVLFINRETCDPGKCVKRDTRIKQFLDRTESNYLQPKKKQMYPSYFKEQKPIVPPVINMSLERNCRIIEECNRIKRGGK